MRRTLLFLVTGLLIASVGIAIGQETKTAPAAPAPMSTHVILTPGDLKWGAPPPVFEQNAQMALVSGDPGKAGMFCVRLKMPAGYKIMPHWHPTDEHVTVLSGTFALGMGDKLDPAAMTELPAGGYALLPATMHHCAMAKTECVVQVHGMGPFQLTYVNPADNPAAHAAAASKK